MTKKPNAEEQFKALLQTDVGGCTVVVVYASVKKGETIPTYQKLSMSKALDGRFREIARDVLEGLRDGSGKKDVALLGYAESSNPHGHQVECLDIGGNDFLKDQIANLGDVSEISSFEAEKHFMKGLRFYGIIVQPGQNGGTPIQFFRKYSTAYLLGKKRFAIHWSREHFDLVAEQAYLFDDRIDCIVFGDFVFVLRKNDFKKIFQFYVLLQKEADKALAKIRQTVAIHGADEFEAVCKSHPYRLALLRDISQQAYLSQLTTAKLKKAIQDTRAPVKMLGTGKDAKLVFDKAEPWAILHLLNDDYLKSGMTGEYYQADSKHRRAVL